MVSAALSRLREGVATLVLCTLIPIASSFPLRPFPADVLSGIRHCLVLEDQLGKLPLSPLHALTSLPLLEKTHKICDLVHMSHTGLLYALYKNFFKNGVLIFET